MPRPLGYTQAAGLRTDVAVALGRRMRRPKRVTTSSWAAKKLGARPLRYAANDAYAALMVYQALRVR